MGRAVLEKGRMYELHTGNENHHGKVLECIYNCPDEYSRYTSLIRSTVTGWTMVCHGINMYPDGTIDWDFSTDGMFTDKLLNGSLKQHKF